MNMWSLLFKSTYPSNNTQVPFRRFSRLFSWRNDIPLNNSKNTDTQSGDNAENRENRENRENKENRENRENPEKHIEFDDDDDGWSYVERPFFQEEF